MRQPLSSINLNDIDDHWYTLHDKVSCSLCCALIGMPSRTYIVESIKNCRCFIKYCCLCSVTLDLAKQKPRKGLNPVYNLTLTLCAINGVSGSYGDAIFEFVAHKESKV